MDKDKIIKATNEIDFIYDNVGEVKAEFILRVFADCIELSKQCKEVDLKTNSNEIDLFNQAFYKFKKSLTLIIEEALDVQNEFLDFPNEEILEEFDL